MFHCGPCCAASRLPAYIVVTILLVWLSIGRAVAAEPLAFRVRLDPAVADRAVNGRLYVFLSQRGGREPMFGPDWFRPQPFFRLDVDDFQPGASRVVDARAEGFPGRLDRLRGGTYWVQALLDHNPDTPHHAEGEGNWSSGVRRVEVDSQNSGWVDLLLDRVIHGRPFSSPEWAKEIKVQSKLLSDFHHRSVEEPAMVVLPPSYDRQPERRYPVVYIVPGFGGSHQSGLWRVITGSREAEEGQVEFIRVMLSGQCEWGHHVYANSATNGPRGDALVRELVPYVDAHYRTVAEPAARFVTGHSSGGWSSLWLEVNYPDVFGGVWSLSPDPVDFRDFQQVNLYADPPLSLYSDEEGRPRPVARRGTEPVLWFESFCRMDDVLGRGGQMRSFEAVFSPRGSDGLPQKLWDRTTGRIDPVVARAWRKYDIRLILEENWHTLGPKLSGKLHITTGQLDTFYLEGAVKLLAASLRKLGSDAQVEIVPGADHSGVLTAERARKNIAEMSQVFLDRDRNKGVQGSEIRCRAGRG